jgi:hypothetical protein
VSFHCDIDGLDEIINISPKLIYSCCYWASHLVNDESISEDHTEELERFVFDHVLHWLEVLSFVKELKGAYSALVSVQKMEMSHS